MLSENPGERDLAWSALVLIRDSLNLIDNDEVLGEVFFRPTRQPKSDVALAKVCTSFVPTWATLSFS